MPSHPSKPSQLRSLAHVRSRPFPCLQTRTHVPWSNCKTREFDLNEPTRNSGHHGISGKKTRPLGGSPHSVFGAISHFLPSGYLTVRHGKLPIEIDGLPINSIVIFYGYVKYPDGNIYSWDSPESRNRIFATRFLVSEPWDLQVAKFTRDRPIVTWNTFGNLFHRMEIYVEYLYEY